MLLNYIINAEYLKSMNGQFMVLVTNSIETIDSRTYIYIYMPDTLTA